MNHAANHLHARIIRSDQGKTINSALEDVQLKLTGVDTDGSYTLGLVTTQVGGSIPPHLHHREDELLILLFGELDCLTSDGWQTAYPGDVVFFPSGVMHAYRNVGTVPAKHWVIANPAGVEGFYQQLAPLLNPTPSLNHISTLSRDYGIEFMGLMEPGDPVLTREVSDPASFRLSHGLPAHAPALIQDQTPEKPAVDPEGSNKKLF